MSLDNESDTHSVHQKHRLRASYEDQPILYI